MRRIVGIFVLGLLVAGCSPMANTADTSNATPSASKGSGDNNDPGCTAALAAISEYGPSTVKLLADGREALNNAGVSLLVDALDAAANAASAPQVKQGIQTLATAYDDYFGLTTDAVAIPLSTLLKDTADLEFLCH